MKNVPVRPLAQEGLLSLKLTEPAQICTSDLSSLSFKLTEALTSQSLDDMRLLEGVIRQAIRQLLPATETSVLETIKGSRNFKAELEAFSIGQIAFAQRFAAHVVNRRVDDQFLVELNDPKWRAYLQALYEGDKSNKVLGNATNQTEETVSRKIKELRQRGVTDFRREGTSTINFLTPVARQIMRVTQASQSKVIENEFECVEEVKAILASITGGLPAFLRHAETFADETLVSKNATH